LPAGQRTHTKKNIFGSSAQSCNLLPPQRLPLPAVYDLTTLRPYDLTTLQPYDLTTLRPYNLTTLQPPYDLGSTKSLGFTGHLTTLRPYDLRGGTPPEKNIFGPQRAFLPTLQPYDLTTLRPYDLANTHTPKKMLFQRLWRRHAPRAMRPAPCAPRPAPSAPRLAA
jgi:hypothetical protein